MSADGSRLFGLSAPDLRDRGGEKRMIVWDLVTGRELLNMPAIHCRIFALEADGRRLHWVKEIPGTADVEMVDWDGTPQPDGK